MKNPITLILISILLIALTCTCEKEETENPLPQNTEIGANTFIFRVNGGEIIESEVSYLPTSPRIRVSYNHVDTFRNNDYLFTIEGNKLLLEHNKSVYLQVNYLPSVGEYELIDYLPLGKGSYATFSLNENENKFYVTNSKYTGEINITKLDTINHIISGKFMFKAQRYIQNVEQDEYVSIDGQFDVKYKPNEGVNYY